MKKTTAFFLILSALLSLSCNRKTGYVAVSGYAQGGTYTVKFNTSGLSASVESISQGIDSILVTIDTTLSGYNKGSILSRFNAGESVRPNAMFKEMYSLSREWFLRSEGALDVAAGPLFDAWGFGFTSDSMPAPERVASLLRESGMGRLKDSIVTDGGGLLSPESLLLTEGVLPKLNFNAIAQGYSCDAVASYLKGLGVEDMLVEIGEIYCSGKNPSGQGWGVGIDRPEDGNNQAGKKLQAVWESDGTPCGIVTSGNYRKFYIKDGKKYSHTIDPRTGYPVDHSLLSATIVAPTAAAADAAATWCMVIGLDEARKVIGSSPDLEGYLVYDEDGTMKDWASEGFTLRSEALK